MREINVRVIAINFIILNFEKDTPRIKKMKKMAAMILNLVRKQNSNIRIELIDIDILNSSQQAIKLEGYFFLNILNRPQVHN